MDTRVTKILIILTYLLPFLMDFILLPIIVLDKDVFSFYLPFEKQNNIGNQNEENR